MAFGVAGTVPHSGLRSGLPPLSPPLSQPFNKSPKSQRGDTAQAGRDGPKGFCAAVGAEAGDGWEDAVSGVAAEVDTVLELRLSGVQEDGMSCSDLQPKIIPQGSTSSCSLGVIKGSS